MGAKSRKVAVWFNLSLAAIFCFLLVLAPLMALSPGATWTERLAGLPGTLTAVWKASHTAALITSILPGLGAVVCIFGLGASLTRSPLHFAKIAEIAFSAILILVVIASFLSRGLPLLGVALLPLGFALYAARKNVSQE